MSELTFADVQKQFFDLYHAQAYAAMLGLVERNADVFLPGSQAIYYNWKMCAAALSGNTALSLAVFQEALDQGLWWGEQALYQDPDLNALHGQPEYERLVAISLARQVKAQTDAKPDLIVTSPPASTPAPYPWLLALHGNMSNPRVHAFADPWQPAVSHGWLLALPQSGQLAGPDRYIWDDREWVIREVQQHVAALRATYAIDTARSLIGGFSMGGGQALWLALTGTIPVQGVIAVAPWLADHDVPLLEAPIAEGKAAHLQIVITVSTEDADCYRVSQAVLALLTKYNVAHTLDITHQDGHGFPSHFETLLTELLTRIN